MRLRGGLGVVNQLAVTFGIFSSMILGLNEILGSSDLWPVLLAIIAVPSLIQVSLHYCLLTSVYKTGIQPANTTLIWDLIFVNLF